MVVANRWLAEAVGVKANIRLRTTGASIVYPILLVVSPPPAGRVLGTCTAPLLGAPISRGASPFDLQFSSTTHTSMVPMDGVSTGISIV